MMRWLRSMGPGLLVTAAFIGPGTIITASGAGATYGLELLWAALFSILAAMILQEMAARLGVVARQGLGESIRASLPDRRVRIAAVILVVSAIAVGNAAFQYGNIAGAVAGMMGAFNLPADWNLKPLVVAAVGVLALGLLATGSVRAIQVALSALVAVMSVVFIVTAFLTPTDWSEVRTGLVPYIPKDRLVSVIALIGTTVVPYNLFLHASASRERWAKGDTKTALAEARFGTLTAIAIGGVITISIMVVAAGVFAKGTDLKREELFQRMFAELGGAGQWMFAFGLFAAGLTSSVTAPLAAAYATSGIIGFSKEERPWTFRAVWLAVLVIGTGFAMFLTASPTAGIVIAQATNGVLLPLIAGFLLWVVNRRDVMGDFTNGKITNILGFVVIGVATVLGYRNLHSAVSTVIDYLAKVVEQVFG